MAEPGAVLVTGGTGFIGRHVVARARNAGWRVVVASRSAPSNGLEHRPYELGSELTPSLLHGITHVIHAAYVADARHAVALNVRAAERLLAAVATSTVKRCLFVSSFSASADAPSSYGLHKFECERRFIDAGHPVLRLGLVLGPGGLAQAMARHIQRWRVMPLLDGGTQPVQTVHIDDATDALLHALTHASLGPWNVAEEKPVTYRAFCEALARVVGVTVHFLPLPSGSLRRALALAKHAGLPLPAATESLRGLSALQARDTTTTALALSLRFRTTDESLSALGASGVVR